MDIVHTRGFQGLYSGLSPTLVEIIPYAGLQFGTYDTFKRWGMVKFHSFYLTSRFFLDYMIMIVCYILFIVQL